MIEESIRFVVRFKNRPIIDQSEWEIEYLSTLKDGWCDYSDGYCEAEDEWIYQLRKEKLEFIEKLATDKSFALLNIHNVYNSLEKIIISEVLRNNTVKVIRMI